MNDSLVLYRRLLGTLRPYRKVVALSVLAMIAAAALEPVLPALLEPLVDESLIGQSDTARWQVPLFLLLAFAGKGVAEYVAGVASQWIAHKAITDLRRRVFRHQLHLPLTVHQAESGGRMLSRVLYDIPQVGAALSTAWIIVVRDSCVILGLAGYLIYTAWELTLLILAIAPVVAWLIRAAGRKLRGSNRDMQETTGWLTGAVEASLAGIREIKLFGAHDFEDARFGVLAERLRQQTMHTVRVSSANAPLVQMLAAAAVSAVIWTASMLSADNRLTPGEFVAFVTAMSMLFEPIRRLTNINAVIQRGLAGARSIFDLLDTLPEADTEAPARAPARGELRFEQVEFRYPGQDGPALAGLDLAIEPGETVALVGASGSGKSTVVNLVARFFAPSHGRVLLDGEPLERVPLGWLRRQLGWVGQQVVLFDETIAANIAYGRPDTPRADIEAAARAAHAWDFIAALPDGLDTRIGPDGGQLSGGQRQRIAIARAFLRDARILLLDEATSALDNASERAVKDALDALRRNRTVLVIAHRLSTIRDADRIVVMAHGRIVDAGSHAQLAGRPGPYARLLASGDAQDAPHATPGAPARAGREVHPT